VDNLDGHSAQFEVSVTNVKPWTSEGLEALGGPDRAHPWASMEVEPRPDDTPFRTVLLDEDGEGIQYMGGVLVLSDVQRIARVTVTTYIIDTCKYGRAGVAEIERQSEEAVIELFDLIRSSKTLRARAPRCPSGAKFVMVSDDSDAAIGQVLTADFTPKAIAWFVSHSQD